MKTLQAAGATIGALTLAVMMSACSGSSGGAAAPASTTPKTDAGFAGYGQSAASIAKQLHCASTKRFGSVIRCVAATGEKAAISTFKTETEQSYVIAITKDKSPGDCAVVLDGVVIAAADEPTLTAIVGVPEQFAHDNGGYTLCPIGG